MGWTRLWQQWKKNQWNMWQKIHSTSMVSANIQCSTTSQTGAPLRDAQTQNQTSSLIGWDSGAQHAIGRSVEAEIKDTGSEKRLGVDVDVAASEWTTCVGDDTTEVRIFFHKGTLLRPIVICGSTPEKDIPWCRYYLLQDAFTLMFQTAHPGWLVGDSQLCPNSLSFCASVPLGKTLSSVGLLLKFPHIPVTLFSWLWPILTSKVLLPSNWTVRSVVLTTM